ncbi:MAG: hypothetical protein EOM85_03895 [Candidatus Moranbacteria bacterium]|nr:hypothetical protein [Candidatus Moranbacteria bacterium]
MRLIKFSLIVIVLAIPLVLSSKVLAVEQIPAEKPVSGKSVVLAEINVQDAQIVSQEGNTLEISFSINNRQGAQSGVKYGVRVVEKIDKKQKVLDEYVFPEILSVPTNASIKKVIKYFAPVNLEGKYNVYVSARNYSGLPLGTSDLGEVTFSKQMDTLEILNETCSTIIERAGSVKENENREDLVSKEDKVILSCYVKNNLNTEVTSTPVFETHYRTLYGEEVSQLGGDVNPITLRPLEEKLVNLTLPKIVVPQTYVTKIFFETSGVNSNYITIYYTVSGLSATIQNVSLDKNSYKANETAKIAFFWTSSATNREELTSISLKADIVNKNKRSCIESPVNTQMAGVGFIEIPVTISKSCDDPEVTVTLHDASGKVLDQKALIFEANEETNLFSGKLGIIAIVIIVLLVLAGLILYFKNLKDKDGGDKPKSSHIEGAVLAIFFVLSVLLVPGGEVKADTYYITADRIDNYYSPGSAYGTIVLNTNLDKSDYSYGDDIRLSTSAYYDKYLHCSTLPLDAILENERQNIDYSGDTIICGGDELYAENIFISGAMKTGNLMISGYAFLDGTQQLAVNIPLPYTVTFNSPIEVEIRANDTPGELTIGENEPITIRWSVVNSNGATCYCTYDGDKSCGQPSSGDVFEHRGYSNIKVAKTTIFYLECKK